jgi:hypothetical protein
MPFGEYILRRIVVAIAVALALVVFHAFTRHHGGVW